MEDITDIVSRLRQHAQPMHDRLIGVTETELMAAEAADMIELLCRDAEQLMSERRELDNVLAQLRTSNECLSDYNRHLSDEVERLRQEAQQLTTERHQMLDQLIERIGTLEQIIARLR